MRTKGTLALMNISAKKIDWEFGLIVTYATKKTVLLMKNRPQNSQQRYETGH
jgi:hypothetical protein